MLGPGLEDAVHVVVYPYISSVCGPVEMPELPTSVIWSDGIVPALDEVHVDVDCIPDVSVSMTSVSVGIGGGSKWNT